MGKYKDLSEKTIAADPFIQFDLWYREHSTAGIDIPESVSLATASTDGRVSVRTVLLKGYNENDFIFFTNYNSRKAKQISSNNKCSTAFLLAGIGSPGADRRNCRKTLRRGVNSLS